MRSESCHESVKDNRVAVASLSFIEKVHFDDGPSSSFLAGVHGAQEKVHIGLAVGLRSRAQLVDLGLRELGRDACRPLLDVVGFVGAQVKMLSWFTCHG
jgi:hypothetical protein